MLNYKCEDYNIIVKDSNIDKINNAIDSVQSGARVRTIDYKDIVNAGKRVEKELNIPKKYLKGVKVRVDQNAKTFPKSYKYTPASTKFWIKFTGKEWKLYRVARDETEEKRYNVFLTKEAREYLITREIGKFESFY